MSTLGEVEDAIMIIRSTSDAQLALLHCVSQYPCNIDQVNLKAIKTMELAFGLHTGYSDHTVGSDAVLAAVSLGARIIEKHFTLDKKMEGPDHKVSMEPSELKAMVRSIRNIEKSMGDGIKRPAPCEVRNRDLLRRSLVFTKKLGKGAKISSRDITIKRPGFGLEPKYKDIIVNKTLKKSVTEDELVTWETFL